jgi:branched-chain amino acid transport system permease protein
VQWVIYGVLMVLIVYFLPEGIVPAVRAWWQRRQAAPAATTEPEPQPSIEAAR